MEGILSMKVLKMYDDRCIGCGTCMTVCSQIYFKQDDHARSAIQMLPQDDGGFHLVTCEQAACGKCVAECPTQAITVTRAGTVLINKGLCINCFACVAACPIGAMRRHPEENYPFKCIACGTCAKECPVDALEIVQEEA
jgi:carbon-monoxide dehydrogenase iron sulfur subunit